MARWILALPALLALLLACGESAPAEPVPPQPVQAALAPTPTLAPTRVPITAPPPPVVPTPVPTPTALPTPPPTPTPSPQFVSTDGIVYSVVEIPRPQVNETLRDELVLKRISGTPLPYGGLNSLEETILRSDVIARVSLVSTRTSWSKRPQVDRWGALLEFRFRVHEYLKGTGPAEIGGITYVGYGTGEEDARAGMAKIAEAHDSRWDGREAIVFLKTDDWDQDRFPPFPTASDQFFFGLMALSSLEFGDLDDAYTVGSRYRKLWLPEANPVSTSTTSGSTPRSTTEKVFLLDAPAATAGAGGGGGVSGRSVAPTTATAPTISLTNLKSKIAALEAEANAGGTPAYRDCVESTYIHWRLTTHQVRTEGTPLERYDVTIASGQPAGTLIHETYAVGTTTLDVGTIYWYDGADKDIVRPEVIGARPGWISGPDPLIAIGHVTTRPLLAGDYTFFTNGSDPACNLRLPNAHNHDVVYLTVTPGDGLALHEAFFDPVAIGTAVGADGTNGVLNPSAFSLDGTTTTITSLKWEDGEVTMALSPTSTSLADYAIDFIDTTGTTTLSLSSDNASTTALTWTVADAPWADGDLLMLRLHNPAPPPPVTVTIKPRPQGGLTFFDLTVSWNDPQACDGRYFVYLGTDTYLIL